MKNKEKKTVEEVYEEPTVKWVSKPDRLDFWIYVCFIGAAILFLLAGLSI